MIRVLVSYPLSIKHRCPWLSEFNGKLEGTTENTLTGEMEHVFQFPSREDAAGFMDRTAQWLNQSKDHHGAYELLEFGDGGRIIKGKIGGLVSAPT